MERFDPPKDWYKVLTYSEYLELREELFWAQNGSCYYCEENMVYGPGTMREPKLATIEHLTPLARGGTWDRENLVAACHECNNRKGNRTEAEYREWMKANDPSRDCADRPEGRRDEDQGTGSDEYLEYNGKTVLGE
jgi:5-methylcytosine-specific restriction endonuclease McrA